MRRNSKELCVQGMHVAEGDGTLKKVSVVFIAVTIEVSPRSIYFYTYRECTGYYCLPSL
jgi:hypothetical protein